jgi:antitoxin FitA
MAQLLIRKLDEGAKERLRARAKKHGRSLEAEARAILEEVSTGVGTKKKPEKGLGTRIAERFRGIGFTEQEKREFDRSIEERWRSNPPRSVKFDK